MNILQRLVAQVNTRDGGKTFKNPNGSQVPSAMPTVQGAVAAPNTPPNVPQSQAPYQGMPGTFMPGQALQQQMTQRQIQSGLNPGNYTQMQRVVPGGRSPQGQTGLNNDTWVDPQGLGDGAYGQYLNNAVMPFDNDNSAVSPNTQVGGYMVQGSAPTNLLARIRSQRNLQ